MCQVSYLDIVAVDDGRHAGRFLVAFNLDRDVEFHFDISLAVVLDFRHSSICPDYVDYFLVVATPVLA